MDLDFAYTTSLIKKVAKTQMLIDKDFAKESQDLRLKLLEHKISGEKFWEQYKGVLLKSVGKNKVTVQEMFKKIDKEILKRFKEAEEYEKKNKGKPLLDFSLPN